MGIPLPFVADLLVSGLISYERTTEHVWLSFVAEGTTVRLRLTPDAFGNLLAQFMLEPERVLH